MSKTSKMHELLAVEGEIQQGYQKILKETGATFDKGSHFLGHHKTLKMFSEDRAHEESAAESHKKVDDTVDSKLRWAWKAVRRYTDAVLQKEATNQTAVADIVVDDTVLAENMPAPFLLNLEKRLAEVRALYDKIPTLAPGVEWADDPGQGDGIFRAIHDEVKQKTENELESRVLYDATKEHPAQIKEWTVNKPVGNYHLTQYSGMVSPAKKAILLGRIDQLIRAVKKARQRANQAEVVKVHVGEQLFNFIHGA